MKINRTHVNGWSQSTLLPPEQVRIGVTIHLDAGSGGVQMGIEVHDVGADQTLGLSTWHLPRPSDPGSVLVAVEEAVALALSEWYHPF